MNKKINVNEISEKNVAMVIRAIDLKTHFELQTYWGQGIAMTFNLARTAELEKVQAGDMCHYSTTPEGTKEFEDKPIVNTLPDGTPDLRNNQVFIRPENSNFGQYYRIFKPS